LVRFDDPGQGVPRSIYCASLVAAQQTQRLAAQHGLTATARLVAYARSRSGSTIQPRTVPNFHSMHAAQFQERWNAVTS
jgi:hypothetical protein